MLRRIIIISLFFCSQFYSYTTIAQNSLPATCDPIIEGRVNNPYEYIRSTSLFLRIQDSIISKRSRAHTIQRQQTDSLTDTSTLYTIPVVVHIVKDDPYSVTDNMVIEAIDGLNQAFAHQGPYSVDTNGVNSRISFCLARTYPNGALSTGITRTVSFYGENDMELESFQTAALQYWDPTRYLNIWVVNSIQGEIKPSNFSCGSWQRMGIGGYAAAGVGAVVGGLGVPLLAHEVGHYLSLLHTFAGGCRNNDCTADGDLVCDTPPDATTDSSPCNNPGNSCTTDAMSGPFRVDVRDNISNFMDYGSPCPTVFTRGQGERMRTFLEVFNNGTLINSIPCSLPCNDNIIAFFNWGPTAYPVTGDFVTFSNASQGATSYKWYVNGVLLASTVDFGYRFITDGSYEIMLESYNADGSCHASYSTNLIINCGVVARFSPNKRMIASQTGVYSDPVTFVNKSHGGTSFRWYVSGPTNATPQLLSTDRNFVYDFPQPGNYSIYLEAQDGTCISRSPSFSLLVENPIPDAQIRFRQVDCYKKDSIRVVLEIKNNGFDTIPAGLTIKFYDRDPRTAGAVQLFNPVNTTQFLLGKCSTTLTHIVAASRPRLDTIFAFFDEEMTINESSYSNNITGTSRFQFRLSVTPSVATILTNTDQNLSLNVYKGPAVNINWSSTITPTCINCVTTTFRIIDTTRIKGYGENIYGCPDSGYATINVFPLDASIRFDSIFCYKNDSLLVKTRICLGNNYRSIKQDLNIDFYENDTLSSGNVFLGRGVIPKTTNFSSQCTSLPFLLKMTNSRRVFAYLNPDLKQYEANTINNNATINYTPFDISFPSSVFEVYRGTRYQLQFNRQGDSIYHLTWSPSSILSCSNCFSPFLQANVSQTLKLNVATQYLCVDSAQMEIKAFYQSHFRVPNVFTPNSDGINDYFYVIAGRDVKKINLFQVINRWGEKVFETQNAEPNTYQFGWDGTKNNKPLPQGTYVYYIVIELIDGRNETYKGNITLVR